MAHRCPRCNKMMLSDDKFCEICLQDLTADLNGYLDSGLVVQ